MPAEDVAAELAAVRQRWYVLRLAGSAVRVEDFNDLNLGATRRCAAWSGAVALVSDHVIRAGARPTGLRRAIFSRRSSG
jgi:hypothetical protein